jgi:bifunctional DNA-binding transcriptional regulator/antitoxin component of YhaV-PrlF toxin-antitoxin module
VPAAVAVGWELAIGPRIVIVEEVHHDHIIVKDDSGKSEKIEVVKEDTEENTKDLEGSEVEEEVEEE